MAGKVTIWNVDALRLPETCVVCHSPEAQFVEYTQEHIPVVIPPFGFHTRTQVALPYCSEHERAFRRRFLILRVVQYTLVTFSFACGLPGIAIAEEGGPQYISTPLIAIAMTSFFLGLPASVIVRHFLYDAFFRYKPENLLISSKHSRFISELHELNHDHADHAARVSQS